MMTDINLNLYRIFYVCANSSSFVDASTKLYISQPAVSKHIKNLEEILDTKLFYRNSDGLILTDDGKRLYNYVSKAYNYLVIGEKVIRESNNVDVGTIIIGAPAHIASFYLLEFVNQYRMEHPKVNFKIVNGSTAELIKGLDDHKIDFVIDSTPINVNSNDLIIEPLVSFDTCFIAPFEYKGRKKSPEKYNYILPPSKSSIRKNLNKKLEKENLNLNAVLEVETTDLIISSVKNNIGVGYVVKKSVQKELEQGELIEISILDEKPTLDLNLVYYNEYLSNLSRFFIDNYIKK